MLNFNVSLADTVAACGIALRIYIGEQNALAESADCGGEIDSRGRFAYAALLVYHGNGLCHTFFITPVSEAYTPFEYTI